MARLSQIARKHVAAAIAEAGETGYQADEVGRAILSDILRIWRETRPLDDIARELVAAADNLDPDTDYPFMRP